MEYAHDYVCLIAIIVGLIGMYMTDTTKIKKQEFCWYCKTSSAETKLKVIKQKNIEHDLLECDLCTELLTRAFGKDAKASDWESARATAKQWCQKDYSRPKKVRKDEWSEDTKEGPEEVRT